MNCRLLATLVTLLVLWSLPHKAGALSYVMMKDGDLLAQSEGVASFEVIRSLPTSPGQVETRYLLRRTAVIAGNSVGHLEHLVLPGIADPDRGEFLVFPGVPTLQPGQKILVFHSRRRDGVLQSLQLTLGLFFEIETDKQSYYVRTLDHAEDIGRGKNAAFARPRLAREFERWIRSTAAHRPAEIDYFIERLPIPAQEKYRLGIFSFGGSNPPPPGPGRWFQFDDDTDVDWFASGTQLVGAIPDEYAIFQSALAAWNNAAGTDIRLNYGGIGTTVAADRGVLYWNDDNPGSPDQIPGSFNCSTGGTLGIGGSSASSPGRTFDGSTWYVRSSGRVVVQDGAACAFNGNGGANGAELLTHEIGHSLAFSHSCGDGSSGACTPGSLSDEATMRAYLHGDGRGAALGLDDLAGAQAVYPGAALPMADLSVSISDGGAVVAPGGSIAFNIVVANAGPDAAGAVNLSYPLPSGDITFASGVGSGWSCSSSSGTVTCTRATLAAAASAPLVLTVDVSGGYDGANPIVTSVTVSSAIADPVNGNNSASDTTPVQVPSPDGIFCSGFNDWPCVP
jgi:uncharacterized repeat protein (TIGR01451 family)